jgi:hypothetical protein
METAEKQRDVIDKTDTSFKKPNINTGILKNSLDVL